MFCTWFFPFILKKTWKKIHNIFSLMLNTWFIRNFLFYYGFLSNTPHDFHSHFIKITSIEDLFHHTYKKKHLTFLMLKKSLLFTTLYLPFCKWIKVWNSKKFSLCILSSKFMYVVFPHNVFGEDWIVLK